MRKVKVIESTDKCRFNGNGYCHDENNIPHFKMGLKCPHNRIIEGCGRVTCGRFRPDEEEAR